MLRRGKSSPARCVFVLVLALPGLAAACSGVESHTIKIGLATSLSGQSARAGEALTRGLTIAIDELNAQGGALGRRFELVRRDDESCRPGAIIAAPELIYKEKVAVLFGGLDTPVSLAIVPLANAQRTPFMGPWAAGTSITRNGASPNYVFRVSAVDEIVDKAMLQYAQEAFGTRTPGMILVNKPLGNRSRRDCMQRSPRNT